MFGASFQPGVEDQSSLRRKPQTPVQQALQILSLRLPKLLGAQAPSARALMTGPTGPDVGAVVESILRGLQGGGTVPGGTVPGQKRGTVPGAIQRPGGLTRQPDPAPEIPYASQSKPRVWYRNAPTPSSDVDPTREPYLRPTPDDFRPPTIGRGGY